MDPQPSKSPYADQSELMPDLIRVVLAAHRTAPADPEVCDSMRRMAEHLRAITPTPDEDR